MNGWGRREWGIPDWRDAPSYSFFENWEGMYDKNQIDKKMRWEFLRRREDYREAYFSALSEQKAPFEHQGEIRSPGLHGGRMKVANAFIGNSSFGREIAWPFAHKGAAKYKLLEFYDPAFDNFGFELMWQDSPIANVANDELKRANRPSESHIISEKKASVLIDLTQPLDAQWEQIKSILLGAQSAVLGLDDFKKYRDHRKKWPLYLRALDAKQAGASLSEISGILPPYYGNRSNQAAQNVLDQAIATQAKL